MESQAARSGPSAPGSRTRNQARELPGRLRRVFPLHDNISQPLAGRRPFHCQVPNGATYELRSRIMRDPGDKRSRLRHADRQKLRVFLLADT